jgi:ribosomal protein S18 acetylase RimI-like enzyme
MTHPDMGTEMVLYELGVEERFRRRGYGTALVKALADLVRDRQCYAMWFLADDGNQAALATYSAAGGTRESAPVMLGWKFNPKERDVHG